VGGRYDSSLATFVGHAASSEDGSSWKVQKLAGMPTLVSVAYAGGVFVAVGPLGTIISSTDGERWVPQFSTVTNRLGDVQAVGNGFVAVGDRGAVLSSPDGVTWNRRDTPGSSLALRALAANGTRLLAVGNNQEYWWSDNGGLNWGSRSFGQISFTPDRVTFGEGLWVAAANRYLPESRSYSLQLAVSADGLRWDWPPPLEVPYRTTNVRFMAGRLALFGQLGKLLRSKPIQAVNKDPVLLGPLGTPIAGTIENTEDPDWYVLDLDSPGILNVWTSGSLNTVGELHGAGGLIVANDDHAGGLNFSLTRGVVPGRYWVKVNGFGAQTGDYQLQTLFTRAGPPFVIKDVSWTGPTRLLLKVATAIGYRYQVEQSVNLGNGPWSSIGDVITATSEETSFNVAVPPRGETQRFFRVAVVPP
jgi:hypothetical protein